MERYGYGDSDVLPYSHLKWIKLLLWTPLMFSVVISTIALEAPYVLNTNESNTGLCLVTDNIQAGMVFRPALERANVTSLLELTSLERKHTELESQYYINEYGRRVDPETQSERVSLGADGSYGFDSLYKDFPAQLIYGASPTVLLGTVPLKGPEDVDIPAVKEELIDEFFEKALELQNKQRLKVLIVDGVITLMALVCFAYSAIIGDYSCISSFCMTIPWGVKLFTLPSIEEDVIKPLADQAVFQVFGQNDRGSGLSLTPVSLGMPYDYNTGFALSFPSIWLSVFLAIGEFYIHLCWEFEHKKDATASNDFPLKNIY